MSEFIQTENQARYSGNLRIKQKDPRGTARRPRWQISAYEDEIDVIRRFANVLWRHPEVAEKAVELLEMTVDMRAKKRQLRHQVNENGTRLKPGQTPK